MDKIIVYSEMGFLVEVHGRGGKMADKSSGNVLTKLLLVTVLDAKTDQVINYRTVAVSTLCTQRLKHLYLLLVNSRASKLIKHS